MPAHSKTIQKVFAERGFVSDSKTYMFTAVPHAGNGYYVEISRHHGGWKPRSKVLEIPKTVYERLAVEGSMLGNKFFELYAECPNHVMPKRAASSEEYSGPPGTPVFCRSHHNLNERQN